MKNLIFGLVAILAGVGFGAIEINPADEITSTSNKFDYAKCVDFREWPKCAPIAWNKLGLDVKFPTLYSLLKNNTEKYRSIGNGRNYIDWNAVHKIADMADFIGLLSDGIGEDKFGVMNIGVVHIDWLILPMSKKGMSVVRQYLKKKGLAFVTKDGVNPCETYMKELNDALNAPRFAGLQEWLDKMGVNATLNVSAIPDDSVLAAKRAKIVSGKDDLTPYWKEMLRFGLGVTEYNKFVKEYNGEN